MPLTIALTLGAGLLVGLLVGLLGGGGSILTVPLLIYLAGIPPKPAITASLFVVAATSLAGLVPHALAGRVRWRTGLLFAGTGMVGAYLGGRVAGWLPAPLLLGIFAAMMAAASIVMLRSPRHRPGTRSAGAEGPWSRRFIRRVAILAGQGFAVGVFTGLVGAGGGFMIVPALAVFGGLSMPAAVGTSLLVLTLQSLAGLGGHLHDSSPPWPLTLALTVVAVTSALAGGRLAGRVDPETLRRAFGWLVAAMAGFMLTMQTWPLLGRLPLHPATGVVVILTAVAAVAGVAGVRVVTARRARQRAPSAVPTPGGALTSSSADRPGRS